MQTVVDLLPTRAIFEFLVNIGPYATFQWLQAAYLSLFANISINKIFCELQVYFTKGKNSHFISLNRFIEINVLAEMRIFLMADVLGCPF